MPVSSKPPCQARMPSANPHDSVGIDPSESANADASIWRAEVHSITEIRSASYRARSRETDLVPPTWDFPFVSLQEQGFVDSPSCGLPTKPFPPGPRPHLCTVISHAIAGDFPHICGRKERERIPGRWCRIRIPPPPGTGTTQLDGTLRSYNSLALGTTPVLVSPLGAT